MENYLPLNGTGRAGLSQFATVIGSLPTTPGCYFLVSALLFNLVGQRVCAMVRIVDPEILNHPVLSTYLIL